MNTDALERLAMARAINLSVDLEIQFEKRAGLAPMVGILAIARKQAAVAMESLVYADPANADLVRGLQNEIRRYDDLVAWVKQIIEHGKELDRTASEDERDELFDIIQTPAEQQEAESVGLNRDHDA